VYWAKHSCPKRRHLPASLHDTKTQNIIIIIIIIIIVTAVNTSGLKH
jgi:hypothetical protein